MATILKAKEKIRKFFPCPIVLHPKKKSLNKRKKQIFSIKLHLVHIVFQLFD